MSWLGLDLGMESFVLLHKPNGTNINLVAALWHLV